MLLRNTSYIAKCLRAISNTSITMPATFPHKYASKWSPNDERGNVSSEVSNRCQYSIFSRRFKNSVSPDWAAILAMYSISAVYGKDLHVCTDIYVYANGSLEAIRWFSRASRWSIMPNDTSTNTWVRALVWRKHCVPLRSLIQERLERWISLLSLAAMPLLDDSINLWLKSLFLTQGSTFPKLRAVSKPSTVSIKLVNGGMLDSEVRAVKE